jgi:hypothetical protein
VRAITIGHPQQLRLEQLALAAWPEEVWAGLPEPVRAEVLRRLAGLLARRLEAARGAGRS